MGLFDFFPYTSGHTLNLDWIIKTVKKLCGDFQIFKDEVNAKVATIPAEVSAEVARELPAKVAAEVAKITPADINAMPGIESTEYPGCYYRINGGVVEWLNPPLLAGIEYRTTERYNGSAVYTKLLDCGAVVNNKAVNHGAGNGLIRMSPVASGILSTTIYPADNDWGWFVSADQTAVRMTCGSGIENNASWKVQIWYVKN